MKEEVLPHNCTPKDISAYCRWILNNQGGNGHHCLYNHPRSGEKGAGTQEAQRGFIKGKTNEKSGTVS